MAAIYVVTVFAVFVASTGAFAPYTYIKPLLSRRDYQNRDCEIRQCVDTLGRWHDHTTGLKLDVVDNPDTLDQLCVDLQSAVSCISSQVARGCAAQDPAADVIVDTFTGVVGYVCGDEGRNALLSEPDCWKDQGLHLAIEDCAERMAEGAMVRTPKQICGLAERFRTCTLGAVEENSNCSDVAVGFADGLMYNAMQPAAERLLNCEIRGIDRRDLSSLMMLLKRYVK